MPALPRRRFRCRPLAAIALLALTVASGCDGDGEQRVVRRDGGTGGHVALTFSGALTGRAEGPAEVACFEPAEEGDRYTVSIDSDEGIPVGDTAFSALDVAVAGYREPGDYDLGRSLASDEVDRDDFFLLFKRSPHPFGWGGKESSGTLSIDRDGRSGELSLAGWESSTGEHVAVAGTFRCGKAPPA
jgi:hypothetical protein